MDTGTPRKFTLQEANEILPDVIYITTEAFSQLEAARRRFEDQSVLDQERAEEEYQAEMQEIIQEWSGKILQLGALPKGVFTCDFISPNPDTYFCWTFGEERIAHTHKVDETFKDRVPIRHPKNQGFDFSLN